MLNNYLKKAHPERIPSKYEKLQQLTQATVIKHLITVSKLLLPSIIRVSNIKTYLSLQTSQKTLIHFLCIFWQLNCLKIATFPTPGSFCWTRNPDIKHCSTCFAYRWEKKNRRSACVGERKLRRVILSILGHLPNVAKLCKMFRESWVVGAVSSQLA